MVRQMANPFQLTITQYLVLFPITAKRHNGRCRMDLDVVRHTQSLAMNISNESFNAVGEHCLHPVARGYKQIDRWHLCGCHRHFKSILKIIPLVFKRAAFSHTHVTCLSGLSPVRWPTEGCDFNRKRNEREILRRITASIWGVAWAITGLSIQYEEPIASNSWLEINLEANKATIPRAFCA